MIGLCCHGHAEDLGGIRCVVGEYADIVVSVSYEKKAEDGFINFHLQQEGKSRLIHAEPTVPPRLYMCKDNFVVLVSSSAVANIVDIYKIKTPDRIEKVFSAGSRFFPDIYNHCGNNIGINVPIETISNGKILITGYERIILDEETFLKKRIGIRKRFDQQCRD